MIEGKCPKCTSKSLEQIDDYIVCEECGSAYVMELEYEGWFEEGGNTLRMDKNPNIKS